MTISKYYRHMHAVRTLERTGWTSIIVPPRQAGLRCTGSAGTLPFRPVSPGEGPCFMIIYLLSR